MWFLLEYSLLFLSAKSRMTLALSITPPPPQIGVCFGSRSHSSLFRSDCNRQQYRPLYFSANDYDEDGDEKSVDENTVLESRQRRDLLRGITGVVGTILIGVSGPSIANAGEVGARITKAITTSDLGISVRTSVVQGAQLADKIDGKWEKFSDKYGLGSERSKQVAKRPNDKKIPDPLPLNIDAAQKILDVSDEVFLKLMPSLSPQKLTSSIEKVAKLSMPSFERSGISFSINEGGSSDGRYENIAAADLMRFQTAPQFNFMCYAHFKAYSELIIEKGNSIDFLNFRTEYERSVGERLIETLQLTDGTNKGFTKQEQQQTNSDLKNQILVALEQTDFLGRRLIELGLIANVDRNSVESNYDLQDFVDDALSDLIITLSVDGDATLQSQMLLQEQGYRLYPNFSRFVVTEFFRNAVQTKAITSSSGNSGKEDGSHKVSVTDYYFDTNYNSDPDKFEVKQVLLNISIE